MREATGKKQARGRVQDQSPISFGIYSKSSSRTPTKSRMNWAKIHLSPTSKQQPL